MTAHRDDPDRIRAELEKRFLGEMSASFDEAGLSLEERREWARKLIDTAREHAVNATAAAWTQAFERRLAPFKRSVRQVHIEAGYIESTRDDDDWDTANRLFDEANRRFDAGDQAGAEPLYLRVLPLFEASGEEHPVACCLMNIARVEIGRADFDIARARLERAVEILNRLGHQEHAAIAMAHLGNLARRRGDRAAARDWWGKSLTRLTNAGMRDGEEARRLMELLRTI